MGRLIRLFVVSDTHGDTAILSKCIARHQDDVDYWYHLGDSELPPELVSRDFIGVRGNCDFLAGLPLTRDLVFPFGTIHLEHGNLNGGPTPESIKATGCRIFLSGHTHRKLAVHLPSGQWQFNPGSLRLPRDGIFGSYLLIALDEETGAVVSYRFCLIEPLTGLAVPGGATGPQD